MTSRILSVVFAIAFCTALASAGVIRDLTAKSDPNGVVVRWVSDDERGVAFYLVERSVGGGTSFIPVVQRVAVKGDGQSYQYLDETAFKTSDTFYRYRVTPLDASGGVVGGAQFYTGVVQKSVSSVRRTWGSIKAMFR